MIYHHPPPSSVLRVSQLRDTCSSYAGSSPYTTLSIHLVVGLPFARVPLISMHTICFSSFPSCVHRIRPCQCNLACFVFKVIFRCKFSLIAFLLSLFQPATLLIRLYVLVYIAFKKALLVLLIVDFSPCFSPHTYMVIIFRLPSFLFITLSPGIRFVI